MKKAKKKSKRIKQAHARHGSKRIKGLLCFDMDETLIKSDKVHILAFNRAFVKNGLEKIPYKKFERELNGDETVTILKRLYLGLKLKQIKRIGEDKRDFVLKDTVKYAKVIKGVIPTLKRLRKMGYETAIISNCRHSEISSILRHAKLPESLFNIIIGKDEVKHPKPYPDEIFQARKLLHHRADYIIGDSLNDIKAGKRAGIKTIAVTTGNVPASQLRKARPDYLIKSITELIKLLN